MDFGYFLGDLRRRASHTDEFTNEFPPAGFGFFSDRRDSTTLVSNPFLNQQTRRSVLLLNTMADSTDLDLCQNLSKMCISEEERSIFNGSHQSPGFSRINHDLGLHDSFLDFSSRREGLGQSSGYVVEDDDVYHRLGLLTLQEYPNPIPNHRDFTDYMSRHDRHFLSVQRNISVAQNDALMYNANRVFPPLSAMADPRDFRDFPLNLASVIGIYGSVYLMAKDQMGCRLLQKLVEQGSYVDSVIIFREIIKSDVVELAMDQFGNYFVQKLLQVCNEEQRTHILFIYTSKPGLLVHISLNTYGTRVVQKLIETLGTREQISVVKSALKPGFLTLVKNLNGNHVILSCLKSLGPNDNKFVLEAATRFCAEIATHRHGCCVLQRCVLHSVGAEREKLVAIISTNSLFLAQDAFGNYLVQYIIEEKLGGVNIMFELRGHYVKLATQKFSSHVVEQCLRHYPESRSQIVNELVSVPNFEHLLQDPFANYVIQSALSVTKGHVRARLVEKIRKCGNLRTSPYCKRIFTKSRSLKM